MNSFLRDIHREQSKMQGDVENLHRHHEQLQGYLRQYIEQSTREWAQLVLNHPQAVLLIMETTRIIDENGSVAYRDQNEPIRLTCLSLGRSEIWDLLLHPKHSQGVTGTEYHGLTMSDVEEKPTIDEAWADIQERLEGRHIVIFGAEWAQLALQSAYPTRLLDGAFCLHNKCKEYYNEFYNLSLETVLQYQGIDKRRAELTNSRARILMLETVISNIAQGMRKQPQATDTLDDDDDELEDHPF